uniref:Uncharacterized protein n=1 Tax=Anguilla anguilla TaxID=7936 RepID=A0A0E9Q1C4_ANGAN
MSQWCLEGHTKPLLQTLPKRFKLHPALVL